MVWLLNESNFTWKDRLKICAFFLNKKKFWTMADEVSKFETRMAEYVGSKYAIFVSSGSTANTLIAMHLKDRLSAEGKNIVIFPSTTWITSVSPFLREGFTPHFIDITLKDLSLDLEKLEEYLKLNCNKVACVFVTSLLGFSPNIDKLYDLSVKYGVKIMLDNCESTFTRYKERNISFYFTSTTSTYFGHQIQSVEGGFVFTNCKKERDYFLMARNHGMVRSLSTEEDKIPFRNLDVDSRFDFNLLGNNFRNTNINAYIGQLDIKRATKYTKKRKELYSFYLDKVKNISLLQTIEMRTGLYEDVPFSFPIIFTEGGIKKDIETRVLGADIETRPIISGNLLRQTCLKEIADARSFPVSDFIHKNGFYVGLHNRVTKKHVTELVEILKTGLSYF